MAAEPPDSGNTKAVSFTTATDFFECRQCGECCHGFGGTYVSDRDIEHISRYLGMDPNRFASRYCTPAGSRPVLAQGTNGYCIFFDPVRHCTIHPVKPRMCRTWPFIHTLLRHPENWDAMASACPGMTPGVPIDALQRFVAIRQTGTH